MDNEEHIRDLANAIALIADAIANGRRENPHAAARLLLDNAATLEQWTKANADRHA
jgi:hypothetical protein